MDLITLLCKINNMDIQYPHTCGSYEIKYEQKDSTNHNVVYECECGDIKVEEEKYHEFEDVTCICGYEKILIGDVNGDGKVGAMDLTLMNGYLKGDPSAEINYEATDVFDDDKINEMDLILLRKLVASSLPHQCGNCELSFEKMNENKHMITYKCECGILSGNEEDVHRYVDGECVCGAEKLDDDINGDGEITENTTFTENVILIGDVNGDGKVGYMEVTYMNR
jgi:hypothetical protein